jgi:hypothetical protein
MFRRRGISQRASQTSARPPACSGTKVVRKGWGDSSSTLVDMVSKLRLVDGLKHPANMKVSYDLIHSQALMGRLRFIAVMFVWIMFICIFLLFLKPSEPFLTIHIVYDSTFWILQNGIGLVQFVKFLF